MELFSNVLDWEMLLVGGFASEENMGINQWDIKEVA